MYISFLSKELNMILDVYLRDRFTGVLESGREGISFTYDGEAEYPLSPLLALGKEKWKERDILPFFSNLLPDEWERELLALCLSIRPTQTLPFLSAAGCDTPGAVSVLPHGETPERGMREITEEEIEKKIEMCESESFLFWGGKTRVTIGGAQSKMCFIRKNGRWYLPEGNSPTSVIVKPHSLYAENEVLVTSLAFLCHFSVPEVELRKFGAHKAVVSKRYDRRDGQRLHQLDMCQLCSVFPENKYETDGGPGVKSVISAIRKYSSSPAEDVREFCRMLVFNTLVGNCDAHAKNFSLLYNEDMSSLRLSPFYDLVSTAVYPSLDRSLAMKIGKNRNLDTIMREDFLSIDGFEESLLDEVAEDYGKALNEMERVHSGNIILKKIREDSLVRLERFTS